MQLRHSFDNNIQVISVEETRIDSAAAVAFKEAMRQAISADATHIILDLGTVKFIDSSGLGAVVAAMKLLPKTQKLDLADLQPAVDKVFKLTRMDKVFGIHASVDDALAAYSV